MNFFEAQDRARQKTGLLVLLFVLSVLSLAGLTMGIIYFAFEMYNEDQTSRGGELFISMDWEVIGGVGGAILFLAFLASVLRIFALSAGGKVVAEELGGKLILPDTRGENERRLMNVVEEMAIACGTPAPPIYVLAAERGVNAFAAGFSPRDAVIGVTQGAIDHLNRDQLQGVIAHEFSHILNGDMRINTRMAGVLHGILLIGNLGYYITRATRNTVYRADKRDENPFAVLGLGLMLIGFGGMFFGGLIKAALNREREYLADASAVQYTRNPGGLAGAFKVIGGLRTGSKLHSGAASEFSHALFAQGFSSVLQAWMATHPPLEARIRRLDPFWDGKYFVSETDPPVSDRTPQGDGYVRPIWMEKAPTGFERGQGAAVVDAVMADIFDPLPAPEMPKAETIRYAGDLVRELPNSARFAARDPFEARAVVCGLLLDTGGESRRKQLDHLKSHMDAEGFAVLEKLLPVLKELKVEYRLPLIDIAVSALKKQSARQYADFKANVSALMELSGAVDPMKWALKTIVLNHLDSHFFKPLSSGGSLLHLPAVGRELSLMLSTLAYAGNEKRKTVEESFAAAKGILRLGGLQLMAKDEIAAPELDRAATTLARLNSLAKTNLLRACGHAVLQDKKITPNELELIRAVSAALDCPIPLIVPAQAPG
jgi:Zn-dependent protease with chaperone function